MSFMRSYERHPDEPIIANQPTQEATIYRWPKCRPCMSCKHGWAILQHYGVPPKYVCFLHCTENDGVDCPSRER